MMMMIIVQMMMIMMMRMRMMMMLMMTDHLEHEEFYISGRETSWVLLQVLR